MWAYTVVCKMFLNDINCITVSLMKYNSIICAISGSGEITSKQQETSIGSEWSLTRTHWLSLCRKPSVWYSLYILYSFTDSFTSDCLSYQPNPISLFLFRFHLISKGHGLCSHVHVQHLLHVVVMVANILQRIISTCHGICFLHHMLLFSL